MDRALQHLFDASLLRKVTRTSTSLWNPELRIFYLEKWFRLFCYVIRFSKEGIYPVIAGDEDKGLKTSYVVEKNVFDLWVGGNTMRKELKTLEYLWEH